MFGPSAAALTTRELNRLIFSVQVRFGFNSSFKISVQYRSVAYLSFKIMKFILGGKIIIF